jgi:hypothetical protein
MAAAVSSDPDTALRVHAAALGLTAVALLAGGMTVGRLAGRPVLFSGLRQLALGGVAVAVTFGVFRQSRLGGEAAGFSSRGTLRWPGSCRPR